MIRLRASVLAVTLLVSASVVAQAQEPFTLAGFVGLSADSRYKLGGHTELSYYDNNIPLSQARNDLLSFHDISGSVLLSQQWLYFERVARPSAGWGIGGRIDVNYGTDAQKMQSFGNPGAGIRKEGSFDNSWDDGFYGLAIPQLYAEAANEEWSVKAGHFRYPIGNEVLAAPGNFFMSHSYAMFNSEPFTHTGALATYTGKEDLTVFGGWTAGWDTGFDQLNSGSNFLGGATVKATEKVDVSLLGTYGNFGWRDGGSNDSYSTSLVVTANITDKWQYVGQGDMVRTSNPGVSEYDALSLNQYLFYNINEWSRAGLRGEVWRADGIGFNEVTVGVNLKPCASLTIRPEYQKNWAPGIGLDEGTLGIDVILTY